MLQTRIVIVFAALIHAKYCRTPPPVMRELGIPRASVSPSLAPAKAKLAGVAQVLGFSSGKLGLKVSERCLTIGVPPPIKTDPPVLRFPERVTLPVTLWL